MGKVFSLMRHEFMKVLPPTIFFFIAFNVISITNALMLKRYGIDITGLAAATFAALVVGKVVLLADKLPFINRFPEKPLIYNVVWKTMIYITAVFVVRYIEHIIPFVIDHENLMAGHRHLLEEVVWPRFWSVQIWLLILFFVYSALHELVRVMGRDKVLQMFFGTPKPSTM